MPIFEGIRDYAPVTGQLSPDPDLVQIALLEFEVAAVGLHVADLKRLKFQLLTLNRLYL